MAKKKSNTQTSTKKSKQDKKQQLNTLIKILRPKVYITDSSNFKNLVQQLTGNGTNSSQVIISSPPPSLPVSYDHVHAYQENSLDLSFESSCFSTPLEGSPDLQVQQSLNYVLEDSSLLGEQKTDFSILQNWDFESLMMEMDSGYNSFGCDPGYNYGMVNNQQEVCVYDYDFSSFV